MEGYWGWGWGRKRWEEEVFFQYALQEKSRNVENNVDISGLKSTFWDDIKKRTNILLPRQNASCRWIGLSNKDIVCLPALEHTVAVSIQTLKRLLHYLNRRSFMLISSVFPFHLQCLPFNAKITYVTGLKIEYLHHIFIHGRSPLTKNPSAAWFPLKIH